MAEPMHLESPSGIIDRRKFLKGAAVGLAAGMLGSRSVGAQEVVYTRQPLVDESAPNSADTITPQVRIDIIPAKDGIPDHPAYTTNYLGEEITVEMLPSFAFSLQTDPTTNYPTLAFDKKEPDESHTTIKLTSYIVDRERTIDDERNSIIQDLENAGAHPLWTDNKFEHPIEFGRQGKACRPLSGWMIYSVDKDVLRTNTILIGKAGNRIWEISRDFDIDLVTNQESNAEAKRGYELAKAVQLPEPPPTT